MFDCQYLFLLDNTDLLHDLNRLKDKARERQHRRVPLRLVTLRFCQECLHRSFALAVN